MSKLNYLYNDEPVELDEEQLEAVAGGLEHEFKMIKCPQCFGENVVKRTNPGRGGISYYKCLDCNQTFYPEGENNQ